VSSEHVSKAAVPVQNRPASFSFISNLGISFSQNVCNSLAYEVEGTKRLPCF